MYTPPVTIIHVCWRQPLQFLDSVPFFPLNSPNIYPPLTSVLTSGATHNKSYISPIWLLKYWKWNNLLLPWSLLFIGYVLLVTISFLRLRISALSCLIPIVSFQVCFMHTPAIKCSAQKDKNQPERFSWLFSSRWGFFHRGTVLRALIPYQFVAINSPFIFNKYQGEMLSVHPSILPFYFFFRKDYYQ